MISINWTEITHINDTSYKVKNLQKDSDYVFRVTAVNNIGAGPPSPLSDFIRITAPFEEELEKPTILEPLVDKFVGLNEKVVLTSVIGGSPVPTITWYKNEEIIETEEITFENRVTKYVIEETTIDTQAEYKCIATNKVGTAETSCRVAIHEKPTVTVEDKSINQKLRKGKTYTITATISGFPDPEVIWYNDSTVLTEEEDTRITITRTKTESILEITSIQRIDSGKYAVVAKNDAGQASVDLTLKVIDKPERPTALDIKDIKRDSVVIEWTPPVDDGGLAIVKYSIEKCDPEKLVWMKVAEVDKSIITYCVQKLAPNAQYIFRVVAENPIGSSEPIESDPVMIKVKCGK